MEEALHAHLRQPILKILHSHGITRASSVSLNVLSSLLDRYLKSTLESCQEYANHAGRVNLNVYDVLESLDEMGTVLDDLRDYLEVECGVVNRGGEEGQPAATAAEPAGVQRYAKALNPRKEAELQEFKESSRQGLPAPEDRISQRVRFIRLQTPDGMEYEAEAQATRMAPTDSDYDEPVRPDKPGIQLPLSPISNSPPHNSFVKSTSLSDDLADSAIPSFLPPFPISVLDDIQGDNVREKEDELKREAELQKQKEAEEQEKQKADEGTVVVQSFPANYIVPAPYEVSKLQARGTWHLPSISLATMEDEPSTAVAGSPLKTSGPNQPPLIPFVRGSSTTEELLSALHSLTASPSADPANPTAPTTFNPNAVSTNPQRHKVSLVFLGTTPMRYNTPDTLFGLNAPLGPTPRPANPLPTHVSAIEPQPGLPAKGKKQQEVELVTPPAQGRSVGVTPNVIQAVTGTSSRIPNVGRRLLAKPTLLRTKRLAPPPAQKRDDKFLLYHAPDPPLPALWNLAVSGSNSQYGGTGVTAPDGKSKLERNPYGVVEAHMAYTWDWTAKVPWENIEKTKAAPLPTGGSTTVNGHVGTPGGSGTSEVVPSRDRVVPKIHVNFPGRRASTLSSVTPASGSGLIARLPGLAERSPSHVGTSTQGNMPPPPLPASSSATSRFDQALNALNNHVDGVKEETESPMEMTYESKKSNQIEKSTWPSSGSESSSSKGIIKAATATVNGLDSEADIDAEILDVAGDDTKDDIDAEIAEVIGDAEDEAQESGNVDEEIDAVLEDTLGMDDSPVERKKPSPPSLPSSAPKPRLEKDLEEDLEDLLEQSADAVPSKPAYSMPNGHDMDIDILGIGEPPLPPGEGSAYILSEMDYAPASEGGTLKFAHSTTLPLATSALRTTTTPLSRLNGHHLPIQSSHNGDGKLEDQTPDSLDDELAALTGDANPREESPRTTLLHIT